MMSLFNALNPKVAFRGMHLDLKGYPITAARLLALPKMLSELRFNVVMVEWEDMFCWEQENLRNPRAFSASIIRDFLEECCNYGIEPIPLVQTFGHMENVLACEEYASLREIDNDYRDLCPSHIKSQELVGNLVDQIIRVHEGFIKRIHLGADEVRSLGTCPICSDRISARGKGHFYCDFLEPIFDKVTKKGLRSMIWHDMLIDADDEVLQRIAQNSDFVLWEYQPSVFWRNHVTPELIERSKSAGAVVWGASAFKGADGVDRIKPDIVKRISNNVSWMNIAEQYELDGLLTTGWSRYSACCVPCESLEASWDCLLIAASIMWDGSIDKNAEEDVVEILRSGSLKNLMGQQAVDCLSAAKKMQDIQTGINEDLNYYLAMAHDSVCECDRLNPQVKQEILCRFEQMIRDEWPEAISEFIAAHAGAVSKEWVKSYVSSQTAIIRQRIQSVDMAELFMPELILN